MNTEGPAGDPGLGLKPLELDRASTSERVAAALRRELLSGSYRPGTPMRDMELAKRAGVSRATLREALAELVRQGLLIHSLHHGIHVASVDAGELADIYELRRVLEPAGLTRCHGKDGHDWSQLTITVEAMERAAGTGDYATLVEADTRFHLSLVAALEVRRLRDAAAAAFDQLRLALAFTDRGALPAQQPDAHRQLLQTFQMGTLRQATRALVAHLDEAETSVRDLLARVGTIRDS